LQPYLIEIFFNGLKKYVGKSSPIKLPRARVDSDMMSEETEIFSKRITKPKEIDTMRKEVGQITAVLVRHK